MSYLRVIVSKCARSVFPNYRIFHICYADLLCTVNFARLIPFLIHSCPVTAFTLLEGQHSFITHVKDGSLPKSSFRIVIHATC
jgi:hypothetical protein